MISTDSGDTAAAYVRPLNVCSGLRPDVFARLFVVLAVELAITLLEPGQNHLRRFDEAFARLVHRHTKPFELDAPRAAAHAENQAPF